MRDRILHLNTLPAELTVADVASRFGSSGYVVESVPLALYAARTIESLPLDVILRSTIEAGGDTDTVASMTGQLAGTWIGASQISPNMIQLLPNASNIEQAANEFAESIEPLK